MDELLPFLQKYEVWIYVILGTAAIFPLTRLISAWNEWQSSVFGLERESAQRRFSNSLTILVLLIVSIFLEFMVVSFVAPNYPQIASLPTSTLDLLATPTVTLPSLVGAVTAEATAEFTPTPKQVLQEECLPGQIEWTNPVSGQEISGTIELKATINVPNLGYYKYEYARPNEDIWLTLAGGNQPKNDEVIGTLDTSSQLVQGDYLFRLVVYDNQNQAFPVCVIPVRVVQN
ncbi:MAG: hypothetical protein GX491_08935 [Chloroflexi bacterium]|nr:hypothetical protein [Chloroflexota bacterium]